MESSSQTEAVVFILKQVLKPSLEQTDFLSYSGPVFKILNNFQNSNIDDLDCYISILYNNNNISVIKFQMPGSRYRFLPPSVPCCFPVLIFLNCAKEGRLSPGSLFCCGLGESKACDASCKSSLNALINFSLAIELKGMMWGLIPCFFFNGKCESSFVLYLKPHIQSS